MFASPDICHLAKQRPDHELTMWLEFSLIAFAAAVLLHAILSRLQSRGNRVFQFVGCASCGAILLLFEILAAPTLDNLARFAAIAIFGFVCELYVFVFTLVTSSVSVSLLFGGSAATDAPAGDMVVKRVQRMLETGLVEKEAGFLTMTRKGKVLVRIFALVRGILHFKAEAESREVRVHQIPKANRDI